MTKPEAERQLERVKFLRELADFDQTRAKRLEKRALELEVEALQFLSDQWPAEHAATSSRERIDQTATTGR